MRVVIGFLLGGVSAWLILFSLGEGQLGVYPGRGLIPTMPVQMDVHGHPYCNCLSMEELDEKLPPGTPFLFAVCMEKK